MNTTNATTDDNNSGGPAVVNGGEVLQTGAPRRESSILLEGVEYDLSNLLVDGSKKDSNDDDDSSSSSGSHDDDESDSDSDSTSGFASCRSKGTRGARSRGTMSRNISNASTILELPDKSLFDNKETPSRRDSPYRFDLQAMRTLMTSFRGIPELQNSFRLSKHGSIRHFNDSILSSQSSSNNNLGEEDDLLLPPQKNTDEEDKEEDLFLQFADKNSHKQQPQADATAEAKTGANSTKMDAVARQEEELAKLSETPQQDEPQQQQEQAEEEEGIDDLIFDEATGTYVYRDYEYSYPGEPEPHPVDYHEPCETSTEHNSRFTLEEMQADAAMGLDDHDGSGGAYDDEDCEMEISPGIYVPFRGAKETWQAVATQTTHELECFDCGLELVCINDCEFTVCPDCRVVNPVFCEDPVGKPFGVGMGFNKAWVLKKQHLQKMKQLIEQRHEP